MLLDPSDIPASARSAGERVAGVTFYPIPMLSQGPTVVRNAEGRRCLRYMYNNYLFVWFEDDATVHLFHGYLGGRSNLPLKWKLNIEESWHRDVLVRRAREWVRDHIGRFTGGGR